jgi:hypothetical protein
LPTKRSAVALKLSLFYVHFLDRRPKIRALEGDTRGSEENIRDSGANTRGSEGNIRALEGNTRGSKENTRAKKLSTCASTIDTEEKDYASKIYYDSRNGF